MSKYRNVKSGGYDSRKERRRAQQLRLMQECGLISELKEQVPFEVVPKQEGERCARYYADFTYNEDGNYVVEDVKSPITRKDPVYVLKRKLMLYVHGIRIKET